MLIFKNITKNKIKIKKRQKIANSLLKQVYLIILIIIFELKVYVTLEK